MRYVALLNLLYSVMLHPPLRVNKDLPHVVGVDNVASLPPKPLSATSLPSTSCSLEPFQSTSPALAMIHVSKVL